jgi:superfamily II DNA or RNA helicase
MASEGLDIPTLTTLIMATPKTDVCQSVGRILRAKHANPLVIDFVDHHDIFKAQWMKRQAYYVKQGYRIMYTTNTKYAKNIWKVRESEKKAEKADKTAEKADKTVDKKASIAPVFAPFQRKSNVSVAALLKMKPTSVTQTKTLSTSTCGIQL